MPDFVRHVEQRQVEQTVSRFWVLTSMTLGMKVSLTDLISVKKKIGLGLTALAGLVIILAAVTGPSTDPILKFVGTWMFLVGFVWLIVVAVRRGQ